MKHIVLILTLILCEAATPARAETFDGLLEKLKNHPQVDVILAESQRQGNLAEGALGLPDPTISLGVVNVPTGSFAFDREMMTGKVIEFNQNIPSYSLRKARSGMREAESGKQKLMAGYAEARLKALLISRLVELHALDDLEGLNKKQLKLYAAIEEYLKGQMEGGNPVYGRFSEFDVERVEVEHELNNLITERSKIEEDLRWLVGEVPELPIPNVPHVNWSGKPNKLYPVRISGEDIAVAKNGVEEADAAYGLNYSIRTAYMQRDSVMDNNLDDMFTMQTVISIPLWASSNQKPKLRAAKAAERGAESAYEDTKRGWIRQMNVLHSELTTLLNNLQLLKEKEASLGEVIASAERSYESGEASYDTLLEAQIDQLTLAKRLTRHRSRHMRLMAEFNSHMIGGGYENN